MRRIAYTGRPVSIAIILALTAVALLPAQEWGIVSANVGSLEIVRGGTALPLEVKGGTALMEEDLLLTGVRPSEIIGAGGERVALEAGSILRLTGGNSGGGIAVLSGAATVTLPRGGIGREVSVRSGEVTARLRDGSLRLEALPGDRRLLTSIGGRHRISSLQGEERFAEPSVRVGYDGRLRNVEVGAEGWVAREIEEFSANGPGYFADRMRDYLELREQFDSAYGQLLKDRDILGEWLGRYQRGLPVEVNQESNDRISDALDLSAAMEERYYQLRMDLPYLSWEYQEYLLQESSYLPGRLDFLRFLRALLPTHEGGGSPSPDLP